MASSSDPTDYERKRLENIRRNDELMASLKLHSIAAELSASNKRLRDEAKLSKAGSQKKPKSDQTPIVIRRSLRSRGMPPDPPKIPRYLSTSTVKVSPLTLSPISMKDAFREDGSDRTRTETLMRFGKKSEMNDWLRAKTAGDRVCKGENLSVSVKIEEECEVGGSFDLCSKSDSENMGGKLSGNDVCEGENLSDSVEKEENEVGGSVDLCSKLSPENVGEKFSGGRLCKGDNLSVSVKKEDSEVGGSSKIVGEKLDGVRTCQGENLSNLVKKEEDEVEGSFDLYSMTLNPEHVARIFPDKIMHARFFPRSSSRILAEGNGLGDVGFWNLDHQRDDEEKDDGIYTYRSHSGPVSGISIHKHCLSKVFTSCYGGYIRSMDAEKEESGLLNICDERMEKCATRRDLHVHRINSIDFNSDNPNILATSSLDGDVFIWDLRSIDANKPRALNIFSHKRAVHSAYFSPSGKCLASTRFDAYPYHVGMLAGAKGGGQVSLWTLS